jgi:AraC family transcriptional regulator of adaptative response/methylated-DNA-[protein]-cysteine methyltransferase
MHDAAIEYSLKSTPLGLLLVAATTRGVCFVDFGTRGDALRERLAREFPFAELRGAASASARSWAEAIERYVAGETRSADVPLDVRGSQFQRRVWAALRRIPRGETRTYSEIARSVGDASAARAVGRACAANPTPIVVPCHRVVAKDGGLGGFARGVSRKRSLLELEGAIAGATPAAATPAEAAMGCRSLTIHAASYQRDSVRTAGRRHGDDGHARPRGLRHRR